MRTRLGGGKRFVYPGEAIIVATVLAIIPYLILRGLVTRAGTPEGSRKHHKQGSGHWKSRMSHAEDPATDSKPLPSQGGGEGTN
jgi:hypothetical protein